MINIRVLESCRYRVMESGSKKGWGRQDKHKNGDVKYLCATEGCKIYPKVGHICTKWDDSRSLWDQLFCHFESSDQNWDINNWGTKIWISFLYILALERRNLAKISKYLTYLLLYLGLTVTSLSICVTSNVRNELSTKRWVSHKLCNNWLTFPCWMSLEGKSGNMRNELSTKRLVSH